MALHSAAKRYSNIITNIISAQYFGKIQCNIYFIHLQLVSKVRLSQAYIASRSRGLDQS